MFLLIMIGSIILRNFVLRVDRERAKPRSQRTYEVS